jgi:hypothetical protein
MMARMDQGTRRIMNRLGRIVVLTGLAATVSACGVVYKPEVILSGCVSSGRTYDETLRAAKVDGLKSGPGSAEIRFISEDAAAERREIIVACSVNHAGELGDMRVADEKVEGERLKVAREAFRATAQSTAWSVER